MRVNAEALAEVLKNALRQFFGLLACSLLQQNDEFIAAQPGAQMGSFLLRQTMEQALPGSNEKHIADLVTE